MFSNFQRTLAIHPTSLDTVSVIVVIAWLIAGGVSPDINDSIGGLWTLLPESMARAGWINHVTAIITTILTIYIIGELNMTQVLLRINSRAISFVFAALITASLFLHAFQPGYIVMFFITLSFFPLFNSYQLDDSAGNVYVTFLYLGFSALAFPKIIWMTPIYILSLYILRTLNPRSLSAAVLGLLTPFWFVGSIAFYQGKMPVFYHLIHQMTDFHWGGYSLHPASQTIMIWLAFAIFLIGVIDFYMRIYLDKTRTRVVYNIIILHGTAYLLLLLLQPLSSMTLLPVILVIASIMGGHYVANDATPLSNVVVCVFTLFIILSFLLNIWIL